MRPEKLTQLSAIAEILSSAAILLTLVFVLMEIRQNTEAIEQNAAWMRLASLDSGYEQNSGFRQLLLNNEDLLRIWEEGCVSELSAEENAKYDLLAADWIILQRNIAERGMALSDEEVLDEQVQVIAARMNRCPMLLDVFNSTDQVRRISTEWSEAVSRALK